MATNINSLLIPNVTKLPGQKTVDQSGKIDKGSSDEFKKLLDLEVGEKNEASLDKHGIQLSTHAEKRILERNIDFDSNEYLKLKNAIDKLKTKGGQDSLVITDKAAYIVDVNNKKVVTAMDKGALSENVFTKIDSTLFIN